MMLIVLCVCGEGEKGRQCDMISNKKVSIAIITLLNCICTHPGKCPLKFVLPHFPTSSAASVGNSIVENETFTPTALGLIPTSG